MAPYGQICQCVRQSFGHQLPGTGETIIDEPVLGVHMTLQKVDHICMPCDIIITNVARETIL